MNELHKEWLKAAHDDIVLIEAIEGNEQITHLLAFHAQQAVEKSFKAFLEYKNENVPKLHSLSKLSNILKDDIEIQDFQTLELLDKLYIDSRYPNELGLLPYGKPTIDDAKSFYDLAVKIHKQIT